MRILKITKAHNALLCITLFYSLWNFDNLMQDKNGISETTFIH